MGVVVTAVRPAEKRAEREQELGHYHYAEEQQVQVQKQQIVGREVASRCKEDSVKEHERSRQPPQYTLPPQVTGALSQEAAVQIVVRQGDEQEQVYEYACYHLCLRLCGWAVIRL